MIQNILTVVLGIACILAVYAFVVPNLQNPNASVADDGEAIACTMDARMCPGGTFVGRTGPNCEFAACPGE